MKIRFEFHFVDRSEEVIFLDVDEDSSIEQVENFITLTVRDAFTKESGSGSIEIDNTIINLRHVLFIRYSIVD